eukprot:9155-Prorocentrum_minimum.AAC.2
MEVDVKCRFLQSIKAEEALPESAEDDLTKDELNMRSENLKRKKHENDATRKEIAELAEQIVHGVEEFKHQTAGVLSEVEELANLHSSSTDLAAAATSATSGRAQEAELRAEVSNLTSAGEALDAQLSTSIGLLEALEKETKHMENEVRNVQSHTSSRGALESAALAAQQNLSNNQEATEYCAQLRTLLEHLGGLEVQQIDEDVVQLLMTTVVPPAGPPEAAADASYSPVQHMVTLRLEAGQGEVTLAGLEVAPEVPLDDLDLPLLQEGGMRGLARVVREVRARVVAQQHRHQLLSSAAKQYSVIWTESSPTVTVQLPEGVQAQFEAPLEWPRSGTHLSLRGLAPTAEETSDSQVSELFQRVHDQMVAKERVLGSAGLVTFVDAIRAAIKAEVQALAEDN